MTSKPLVSIVVPAYNAEQWVGRAIESVLAQDWPRIELIVVNDGSTDNTEEICLRYKEKIRYLCQPNRGVSAARNAGIQIASGEFIGFLDADDEYLPHMVSTLVEALLEFPEAMAASGAYLLRRGATETRCPPKGSVLQYGKRVGLVSDFFCIYARWNLVWTGAVLVRKQAFDEVGLFRPDLRLGEDIEMWTRIAGRFPWVFVDEVVACYNQNPESSITLKPMRTLDFSFIYTEKEMRRLIRPELWPSYRIFRRDQTLQRCRALLRYGATQEVRAALSRIPPARINASWIVIRMIASLPPRVASVCVLGGIGLKRIVRAIARHIRFCSS